MSESAPPYLVGNYGARALQAAVDLDARAAELSQQLDQALSGIAVRPAAGPADLALQLVQVEAAARLLRDRSTRT